MKINFTDILVKIAVMVMGPGSKNDKDHNIESSSIGLASGHSCFDGQKFFRNFSAI